MKVIRFADLLGVDDPAHPYFIQLLIFPMACDAPSSKLSKLTVSTKAPFAVCNSVDLYGALDEGKGQSTHTKFGASMGPLGKRILFVRFHRTIGK